MEEGASCEAPLIDEMGITHHGRREAVNRALSDFGSEESFEHSAKRFKEHDNYDLSSSTVSRVTKQVAQEAMDDVEQKLSNAGSPEERTQQHPKKIDCILVERDGCEIRTAT